jgi:hypothetical protein
MVEEKSFAFPRGIELWSSSLKSDIILTELAENISEALVNLPE